jgi:hypothetical protein
VIAAVDQDPVIPRTMKATALTKGAHNINETKWNIFVTCWRSPLTIVINLPEFVSVNDLMLNLAIFVYIAAVNDFLIATAFLKAIIYDSFLKITEAIMHAE